MTENLDLGENGLPMLSFPSMQEQKSKAPAARTHLGADKDVGDGRPMLNFSGPKDGFNIKDRSDENQQHAVDELKKEFGSGYKSALKNAK